MEAILQIVTVYSCYKTHQCKIERVEYRTMMDSLLSANLPLYRRQQTIRARTIAALIFCFFFSIVWLTNIIRKCISTNKRRDKSICLIVFSVFEHRVGEFVRQRNDLSHRTSDLKFRATDKETKETKNLFELSWFCQRVVSIWTVFFLEILTNFSWLRFSQTVKLKVSSTCFFPFFSWKLFDKIFETNVDV